MLPGGAIPPQTKLWERRRRDVAAIAGAAIKASAAAAMHHPSPSYPSPEPALRMGFAEGMARFGSPAPSATIAARDHGGTRIAAGDAAALDDTALTASLLALVLPGDPAPVAARVVARFGTFAAALAAPVRELETVPGLGPHSVAALKLVHGAALRAAQSALMNRLVLDDMAALTNYLAAVLARERIEQFRILFLDAESCLIADEAQARGTVNHTPVYPREVVRRAIELRASSVILVHNHPSGDPTPSGEDLEMTAMVRDAAALLGIAVRDHIIVGHGRSLSFREAGLL